MTKSMWLFRFALPEGQSLGWNEVERHAPGPDVRVFWLLFGLDAVGLILEALHEGVSVFVTFSTPDADGLMIQLMITEFEETGECHVRRRTEGVAAFRDIADMLWGQFGATQVRLRLPGSSLERAPRLPEDASAQWQDR